MKRDKITHQRRHIRLRIEILDELLGSPRKRDYKELLNALSQTLKQKGEVPIKERMLKNDIYFLENELGAPIHRPTKSDPRIYYTEKFSLKNIPVDDDDIAIMKKAVAILKKATNIKLTGEIDDMIARLENKIHTNVPESSTIIAFEEYTEALGQEYFDEIFSSVYEKSPLKIRYQPFGKEEREWIVHPYMLKEYRSRWYLIGRINDNNYISHIALDRIKGKIKNCNETFIKNDLFDAATYFDDLVGVSVPKDQKKIKIVINAYGDTANYILTKPIHKSQNLLKPQKPDSVTVSIEVYDNYELRSALLGFGPGIEIIEPAELRKNIRKMLGNVIKYYL